MFNWSSGSISEGRARRKEAENQEKVKVIKSCCWSCRVLETRSSEWKSSCWSCGMLKSSSPLALLCKQQLKGKQYHLLKTSHLSNFIWRTPLNKVSHLICAKHRQSKANLKPLQGKSQKHAVTEAKSTWSFLFLSATVLLCWGKLPSWILKQRESHPSKWNLKPKLNTSKWNWKSKLNTSKWIIGAKCPLNNSERIAPLNKVLWLSCLSQIQISETYLINYLFELLFNCKALENISTTNLVNS